MAGPDNVARLIAAGSALFTAVNMAVSYATFRRKRPTVAVARASCFVRADPQQLQFWAALRNRSEAEVTIASGYAVLSGRVRDASLLDILLGRRPYKRVGAWPARFLDLDEVPSITLEPFGQGLLMAGASICWRQVDEHHLTKTRLTLTLSNGHTITSRRMRLGSFTGPCPCDMCAGQGQQLSFDDLTA
ncbi:hypothetical protein [Streptomyces chartreusis]|uniref:hypothetical protein n=1 Tax=Streptomyces chartreusis TaxID=1969 RepID=UPI00366284A7